MARPKRSKGERERDLILVSKLYLKGEMQAEIARQVSLAYGEGFTLSRQQIGYDIKLLLKRWIDAQIINIDRAKARELARIDKIEREAWNAWERSQKDAETIVEKGKATGGTAITPQSLEKTVTRKGQVGDSAFLRVVQWCVEQRCKILGLETPERKELTGIDGKPIDLMLREVVVELPIGDRQQNEHLED